MQTPKQRFQNSSHAEEWRAVTATLAYERAVDAAMLQLAQNLPVTTMTGFQIEGAKTFLGILTKIAELQKDEKPEPVGVLKEIR